MSWQNYFSKIFIINLPHRTDRLQRVTEIMNEYEIDAFVFEATEHAKGELGLVATMKKLFIQCLNGGYERVLVFEDDVEFLERPEIFNQIMDKCVNDLKSIDWNMFYLGLQHVKPFMLWRTQNVLPVSCGYSTHAVAYSKVAMQWVVDTAILEPVDNAIVREFQPKGTCFCCYPQLATQADTYSDICRDRPNFGRFIKNSYEQSVRDILSYRSNF